MPSLGADMEAGKLVEWLKRPGDAVKVGDIIAVVETQKGAIEIEVFETGIVETLLAAVGETVAVGRPIAVLRGADAPAVVAPQAAPLAPAPPLQPVSVPARPDLTAGAALKASPAARRFAADHGIDLTTIAGSGPDGAIVFVDVEAAQRRAAPGSARAESPRRAGIDPVEMRRAIAAAMARAKREIPHYYLATTVDGTEAARWLQACNASRPPETRILAAAVHLKALALCLRRYPEFNGFHIDGGHRPSERIHVGAAIAIRGGGLVAPAIHDTDRLTLDDIMVRLRDLVGRVRTGRFRSSELSDPTVTLTSLGERGVETIFPVINPPQVAIIGIGAPVERPWVVGGEVRPRTTLSISLAADHRVSDGHRGALLLNELATLLATPEKL